MHHRVLITGGAGFIGCNLASRLAERGDEVIVFDNLSRRGTERNLAWLQSTHPGQIKFLQGDIRDREALSKIVEDVATIFHLAGQVAVTSSVQDPRTDFEVNALGTLNVLEAARSASRPPTLLFTSTNKVYGEIAQCRVAECPSGYEFVDHPFGVDEQCALDFHSPYGCSKGCADQYVRDYHRIYGLRTVVFRMSCIYGPRQFGTEDQGWIAHFMIAAALGRPLTIFGDGKQSRDILHVEDLVQAMLCGVAQIERTVGRVHNIGGGPTNRMSLLELLDYLSGKIGRPLTPSFADWRPGDQRVYVSDIRKAQMEFGWFPRIGVREGLDSMWGWILTHLDQVRGAQELNLSG